MGIIWVALIVSGLATKSDPISTMDCFVVPGRNSNGTLLGGGGL